MVPKKTRSADPQKAQAVRNFINLAFKDYIAARALLNTDRAELALGGAILASTCIEKYFKAIVAFRGNKTSKHLCKALVNSIRNYDPKLYSLLNKSFLEFLQKCYQLRYLDTLPPGFTIGIVSRQVLAELDFTVHEIQKRFRFEQNNKPVEMPYDVYSRDKNPLVFDNNYLLQGLDRTEFIECEVSRYALKLDKSGKLIEVFYTTTGKDNGDFLTAGLIPQKLQSSDTGAPV
jgi:hypothetical protein